MDANQRYWNQKREAVEAEARLEAHGVSVKAMAVLDDALAMLQKHYLLAFGIQSQALTRAALELTTVQDQLTEPFPPAS